jgi:alpha-beta hydrolase superfamily lysophospholipase
MGETPGSEDIVCNDDVLEIVLGLLVAVVPGERFAIAGTSYGGYLARAVIHRRLSQIDGALLWAPAVRFDDVRQLPLHQVLVRDQTAVDSVEPHETP